MIERTSSLDFFLLKNELRNKDRKVFKSKSNKTDYILQAVSRLLNYLYKFDLNMKSSQALWILLINAINFLEVKHFLLKNI
jgi:hypothetical protein